MVWRDPTAHTPDLPQREAGEGLQDDGRQYCMYRDCFGYTQVQVDLLRIYQLVTDLRARKDDEMQEAKEQKMG